MIMFHDVFDLAEYLFSWVQVGRIGREIVKLSSSMGIG